MSRLLLTFLLLLVPGLSFAETEVQWWHVLPVQSRLSGGRALIYGEVQPRGGPETGALIFRSAVGFQALPWLQLFAGFAWIPAFDDHELKISEGRLYQQVTANFSLGPTVWSSRTRFEQRSFQATPELAFRLRTLLRAGVPLNGERSWFAVVSDEVFFHLNTVVGGPQRGFDQNRVFVGLSKKVTPTFTVELGYLNQFMRRPSGNDRTAHVVNTTTSWNLP